MVGRSSNPKRNFIFPAYLNTIFVNIPIGILFKHYFLSPDYKKIHHIQNFGTFKTRIARGPCNIRSYTSTNAFPLPCVSARYVVSVVFSICISMGSGFESHSRPRPKCIHQHFHMSTSSSTGAERTKGHFWPGAKAIGQFVVVIWHL